MIELKLNECLDKFDKIIFHVYKDQDDEIIFRSEIRKTLEYARNYIIKSTPNRDNRTFVVILEFINDLIKESSHPITFNFLNRMSGLRSLILKYEDNCLEIVDKNIDFEERCNSFLNVYAFNDQDEDEEEDEDENINAIPENDSWNSKRPL